MNTPVFKKPAVADVYCFLRGRNALIVHFSGTPKGAGSNYEYYYPEDLQNAVAHQARGGLSCSVVMPGDEFADLDRANATGCIGVVLGLQDSGSLVSVDPHDCGSRVENGVRLVPNERDLSLADLADSLDHRPIGNYNEWVVRDYAVLGILAAKPYNIFLEQVTLPLPPEAQAMYGVSLTVPGPGQTTLAEIRGAFPQQRLFSFDGGKIVECGEGDFSVIEHASIYKT